MNSDINIPSSSQFSRIKFETNDIFSKQRKTFDDHAYFSKRKSKGKSLNDDLMNFEKLSAFLGIGVDSIEKLAAAEISYNDLASLTDKDLELIGFKYHHERENLLDYFAELPNQSPNYNEICKEPEAQKYNGAILSKARAYLENMKHALNGANYKVQISVPDDTLVGDKYFASHFVNEALEELQGATKEVEIELNELYQLVNAKQEKRKNYIFLHLNWIFIAALSSISAIATYWYIKNHQ